MRIVCPACAATYEVPEAMLGPAGRVVRCARCGREWDPMAATVAATVAATGRATRTATATATAMAAGSAAVSPSEATARGQAQGAPGATRHPPLAAESRLGTPLEGSLRRPAAPPGGRSEARLAIIGWLLTALVLGGALVAAWRWRPQFEAAWPPVRRVYLWLGLG